MKNPVSKIINIIPLMTWKRGSSRFDTVRRWSGFSRVKNYRNVVKIIFTQVKMYARSLSVELKMEEIQVFK